MALDVYVLYPGVRAEQPAPRLQLEDAGTLWFLSPFLDAVHQHTGQPSGDAVFSGAHLVVFREQLEAATRELQRRPERWVFQGAIQREYGDYVMSERLAVRSALEGTIASLHRIVDETIAADEAHLRVCPRLGAIEALAPSSF